jgi:agmatine deiminase
MPSETEPQDRVWMAFPPAGYLLGESAADADEARSIWSSVAHAILDFEPVTMIVDPRDRNTAARYLSGEIEIIEAPLNDAWMRDIGPSFVLDQAGAQLGGVDWVFTGWGQQDWASWQDDALIGARVVRAAGAQLLSSSLVQEGGGINVDGLGTVLLTETVQRDPLRNPGVSRAAIEAELANRIGTTHAIWLDRGLTRDSERFGTGGHVDIVASIPSPGVLLVHSQRDSAHPDFTITRDLIAGLADTHDARGNPWRIVEVPAPSVLQDAEGWVDYSYINHLVINGAVIACSFDDPADDASRGILHDAYPGRAIVQLDARPLFARGGGIHCITQQQPRTVNRQGGPMAGPNGAASS